MLAPMELLLVAVLVAALVIAHELMWRRVRRKWLACAIGVAGSYLYVVALAFALYTCRGFEVERVGYTVDEVLPGYDATSKLLVGDRIVAVDGNQLGPPATPSLVEAINARRGAPVMLDVIRAGTLTQIEVAPKLDHRTSGDVWVLGIRPGNELELERDTPRAIGSALVYPFAQVRTTVAGMFASEPVEAGGPKRMVEEFRKGFDRWMWLRVAMSFATIAAGALIVADLLRAALFSRRGS